MGMLTIYSLIILWYWIAKEKHQPGDIISLSIIPENTESKINFGKSWLSQGQNIETIDEIISNSDLPLKVDFDDHHYLSTHANPLKVSLFKIYRDFSKSRIMIGYR